MNVWIDGWLVGLYMSMTHTNDAYCYSALAAKIVIMIMMMLIMMLTKKYS